MSAWPQPTPQRLATCRRALIDLTKVRVQCPKCGAWRMQAGYRKHEAACQGIKPEPEPKIPHGHTLCDCGRIKRSTAESCGRCNGDVLAVDLEILRTRHVPEHEMRYFSVGLRSLSGVGR